MKRLLFWPTALFFLLIVSPRLDYVYGSESEKYYTMLESQVKNTEFIKFLRAQGVKIEPDENGLLRIYAQKTTGTIPAITKFLDHMKTWSEVVVGNIVNFNNTWDGAGKGPYRRRIFEIDKDGNASVSIDEKTPLMKRYLPGHPHADADGYVLYPNITLIMEYVQLVMIAREYSFAESLLKRCLPSNYISDSTMQMINPSVTIFMERIELRDRLDRIERKLDALTPGRQ